MFLIVLAALHWWLGITALAGVLVMAVLALLSNRRTQSASRELAMITGQRSAATLSEIRFADPPLPWACRIAWWRAPQDGRDSSSPRSRRSRAQSRASAGPAARSACCCNRSSSPSAPCW
ncbi:hypothetical protein ACFS32_10335 [Novosphingobium pokkalii]|uniref:hypothetical protein n=1 Tax=Novosphingobium pokkalii TaxID=1770194 RepID=UPI00362AEBB0